MKSGFTYLAVLFFLQVTNAADSKKLVYKDASVPIENRIKNLVTRMTFKEKISQLNQNADLVLACLGEKINWSGEKF
jgi:hypothetical protein